MGVISIISTLVGCLGFMSIWNIVLDSASFINLIMCIGFSVDFISHFCYHYTNILKSKKVPEDEVVERTLVTIYKPVLQGAVTTILAVSGQLFAPIPLYTV